MRKSLLLATIVETQGAQNDSKIVDYVFRERGKQECEPVYTRCHLVIEGAHF